MYCGTQRSRTERRCGCGCRRLVRTVSRVAPASANPGPAAPVAPDRGRVPPRGNPVGSRRQWRTRRRAPGQVSGQKPRKQRVDSGTDRLGPRPRRLR